MTAAEKLIERLSLSPRHAWTQDMLAADFERQFEASSGILRCEAPAKFSRVDAAADDNDQDVSEQSENPMHDPARSISGIALVGGVVNRKGWQHDVKGMDIAEFAKNPVALAQHEQTVEFSAMPAVIAIIEKVTRSGQTLKFKNMTFDTDPLAEAWFQKIVKNFVRMVSVGFRPYEIEFRETAPKKKDEQPIVFLEILKSELHEISPVVIGADRSAFITKTPRPAKKGDQSDQQTNSPAASRLAELEKQIQEFSAFMDEVRESRARQSDKPLNDLQKALADIETIESR